MASLDESSLVIVPDANICVSGASFPGSYPEQIIEAWSIGQVEFALCEGIFFEITDVLQRKYFQTKIGWTAEQIDSYVDLLRQGSRLYPATIPIHISSDKKDDMVFSCAKEAGAAYIVSGDEHHVLSIPEYQGIKTISPKDFVEQVLRKEQEKAA